MYLPVRIYYLSCLLGFFGFSYLNCIITVNGQEFKKIAQDEVLFYESGQANHIALTIQNGAINIGVLNDEEIIKIAKQSHHELLSGNRGKLVAHVTDKKYILRRIMEIKVDNEYVASDEGIFLQAGQVGTSNSTLKSKDIQISCCQFKADTCFMDADTLTLYSAWPYSLFEFIRFTFKRDKLVPHFVRGIIDFQHNKTDDGAFVVVGACRVEFAFSKKAFN